jgi:hypothetical protein
MAGNVVKIYSGESPKYFNFGTPTLPALTTLVNGNSQPLFKESPFATLQAILNSAIGNVVTATVTVQGTNDYYSGSGMQIGGIATSSGSATITSASGNFGGGVAQNQEIAPIPVVVGMLVSGPGVPAGTTVQTVTSNTSIVLSQNCTATSPNVGLVFFANNWCATALGVITLSGTTAQATPSFSDGFTTQSTWRYLRAVVSNVTGTGAAVQVLLGV